jgi:hypothetical protein
VGIVDPAIHEAFCFEKSGPAAAMRALISVSAPHGGIGLSSELAVPSSKLVDFPELIESRRAAATLKQDEWAEAARAPVRAATIARGSGDGSKAARRPGREAGAVTAGQRRSASTNRRAASAIAAASMP